MTALEAMLDPGERARAGRFTFPADRRDFVAAHGLFKEMLAGWLGLSPSQLRMSVDAPGAKPRLTAPGYVGLDVNITHTSWRLRVGNQRERSACSTSSISRDPPYLPHRMAR
jgi:phosphopantetheinyl transferase